jgi:citrate lyase alpha subunit
MSASFSQSPERFYHDVSDLSRRRFGNVTLAGNGVSSQEAFLALSTAKEAVLERIGTSPLRSPLAVDVSRGLLDVTRRS